MNDNPTHDEYPTAGEATEQADEQLTVGELVELLSEHDPDTPVRLATQPAWAFANALAPVAAADERAGVVWLAEGRQLAYLPDTARQALAEAGDPRWTRHT